MKKYTDKELQKILDDINGGAVYVGIKNNCGFGEICAFMHYIQWRHYGSSCEKQSIAGLRWIIENIFNDCDLITPAVYSKYHINYIPIDKQYNAIDFSLMHPNIYGL